MFRKPIVFENLKTEPVSRTFGFDRGNPIDRYYIEKFLDSHRSSITGKVLEIAESTYSKQFGSNVASFEILHFDNSNPLATIIGDLTCPETLPLNQVDCFVCTQTLNFIFDVPKAIEGAYQILKNNGCLLLTVTGLCQISRYDMDRWGDYWRFTDLSIRKLLEPVFGKDNIEIEIYGNVFAATSLLYGLALEDIPNLSLLDKKDIDYQITIGVKAIKRA